MEFNRTRYFLHLADTLNLTEAAMRSGVSGPRSPARGSGSNKSGPNVGLSRWKR
jgi:hypothetical protein